MKKLVLLLAPVALFFSCKTDIPADQAKLKFHKQCLTKNASMFLDETATDAEKEKFCDCYVEYLVGDAETVKLGEMMKKATNVEDFSAAIDGCTTKVVEETVVETPEQVEVIEEEVIDENHATH